MVPRRLRFLGIVSLVVTLGWLSAGSIPVDAVGPSCSPGEVITLHGASCAPLAPPRLSCDLPADAEGALRQPDRSTRQRAADLFSWQEFIALNWPAAQSGRGQADGAARLDVAVPRVWQTWKNAREVYRPNGAAPLGWDDASPLVLPAVCGHATEILVRREKAPVTVPGAWGALITDPKLPGAVTDRAHHAVRYEVRLNRTTFDAVVAQHLYNGEQQAAARSILLPTGAVMLEAAWREVKPEEEAHYLTADACLCDHWEGDTAAGCSAARVGLVGLDIAHKTASAPEWIWSTFEQANNVATAAGSAPSFFDPAVSPLSSPVNRQTALGTPNQLARVTPIPSDDPECKPGATPRDNLRELNREMEHALAGTRLADYQLIGTQWPQHGADNPAAINPQPAHLANVTLESFVQGNSSCMGCHASARSTNRSQAVAADFSFTLGQATPSPSPSSIGAPTEPRSGWDFSHWTEIQRGRALAVDTRTLAKHAVNAHLACTSCHLDAGADSAAAWWVGLRNVYKDDSALADRINLCFEQGLDGKALCSTKGEKGRVLCAASSDMKSLIAYMDWLTEQAGAGPALGTAATPVHHGLIALPAGQGDLTHGGIVYTQRCAVCHGSDGQGLATRPPLWGEASFNACAPLAQAPTLAAFVAATMPRGAGGLVASQDARDVAAFIVGRCRPGMGKDPSGRACSASATCLNGKPSVGHDLQLPPRLPEAPPPW